MTERQHVRPNEQLGVLRERTTRSKDRISREKYETKYSILDP